MYAPFEKQLHIDPVGWSPSTPAGGIKSNVVAISDISEPALRARAGTIRDHVVLLDATPIFADGFKKNYAKYVASYSILKELGATALLLPGSLSRSNPEFESIATELAALARKRDRRLGVEPQRRKR